MSRLVTKRQQLVNGRAIYQSESDTTFEDDLIRDRIETGLPSLQKSRKNSLSDDRTTPKFAAVRDGSAPRSAGSRRSYPCSLPGINLRGARESKTRSEEPALADNAQVESVSSALTIENEIRISVGQSMEDDLFEDDVSGTRAYHANGNISFRIVLRYNLAGIRINQGIWTSYTIIPPESRIP